MTLAWALSRDEGLVSQAVGKAAGWCRDNLGYSKQPHGAKNGKCDQSFVEEGTESHAGDVSQQCEAQRFPLALLPVRATCKKTKQFPGEQQPSAPGAALVSILKGGDMKQRNTPLLTWPHSKSTLRKGN